MPFYKRVLGLACLALGTGMLMVIFLPKWGWVIVVGILLVVIGWLWLMC